MATTIQTKVLALFRDGDPNIRRPREVVSAELDSDLPDYPTRFRGRYTEIKERFGTTSITWTQFPCWEVCTSTTVQVQAEVETTLVVVLQWMFAESAEVENLVLYQ